MIHMIQRFLILFIIGGTVSGCATSPVHSPPPPEPAVVQQREETIGLTVIDQANPEVQKLLTARRELLSQTQQFERDIVVTASTQASQGNWGAAVNTYEKALKQQPGSTILQLGLNKAHEGRGRRVQELEDEILISRGTWLADSMGLYEQLVTLDPTAVSTQLKKDLWSNESRRVAKELGDRGIKALRAGELNTAERALILALRLDPSPELQAVVAELNQRQNDAVSAQRARAEQEDRLKQKEQRHEQDQVAQQQIVALRAALEKAIREKRLKDSLEQIQKLERMVPGDTAARQQRQVIEHAIGLEVQRLLDEGVSHYSKSDYEKALASWKAVLPLQPANEQALANIDRVEKILQKLSTLKEKQSN